MARNAFVLDLSEAAGPHLRSFMHCWLGHSLEKTPHSNVALQSKSLKAESEEKHQSKNSKWTERGERARSDQFHLNSSLPISFHENSSFSISFHREIYCESDLELVASRTMTTAIDWTFDQFRVKRVDCN